MAAQLSSFDSLQHLAYHIFLPLDHVLPQSRLGESADQQVSLQIARSVISAVRKYKKKDAKNAVQWKHIVRMLKRFLHSIEVPLQQDQLSNNMIKMKTNDILALHIRAQNAAVIIRKKADTTVFEVFEVQPSNVAVMSTPGKIVRNYPGPAVEVPNSIANDPDFTDEIANILAQMNTELFDEAIATSRKAGSMLREIRDSNNPSYFTQLFIGILRGMGEVINPPRVAKRIADQVLWKDALEPWRRSPVWLIIRVAIQTSLDSNILYKHFMAFYHAKVLSRCRRHGGFSSDLLYVMRVKMARRLFKVKNSVPEFVVEKARISADDIQEVLQERWTNVQDNQASSPEWDPSTIDFRAATNQTLRDSRAYLNQVFRGRSNQKTVPPFTPDHQPRLKNVIDFTSYANGALSRAFAEDKHVALFDFESSVYENVSRWTSRNLRNATEACKTVSSCFEQYLSAAQSHYTVDIADQSIMLLTLMKLWVAIDELATHQIPLLRDFSPEFPEHMLDALLLRTSEHIEQARIIQQHLRTRHNRALSSNNSIFSDSASRRHFAVQYFQQCSTLQSMKSAIERDAQIKRDAKLQELHRKNNEHAQLDRDASERSHEFEKQHYLGRWRSVHSESCDRCRIERKRDSLEITRHEWPLPSDPLKAQVVVFELQRPVVFTIWRDVTYQILRDLGASLWYGSASPHATLEGYKDLGLWLALPGDISARITLASSTKTFMQSHYSEVSIPTDDDSVCVNNGLKYALYDRLKRHWAAGPYEGTNFTQFGTLSPPDKSPYKHLLYALEGTTHTPNQVLADQYDCPKELSLHEHIAYGTLRSGARLQWLNIVRGIAENILTFSSTEVNLLHTQSAWQIGPLTNKGNREWHQELRNLEYGRRLVSQLNILLDRVRANWLEATTVSTAVMLAARLLVSASDPEVLEDTCWFLREARLVALAWLSDLQSKLKTASDKSTSMDYQNRICEMAAICRSTFDVDPRHIPHLLRIDNADDLASLIKCSVAMYDNRPPDLGNAPKHLQVLLCRDHRLSHKLLPYILEQLGQNRHILCGPISEMWPGYQASPEGWVTLPAPNSRWASTRTAAALRQTSQSVHLNLLEGCFLIDGVPLGRLPRSYVQHPTYVRVFGQMILDVVPANSPGMKFAMRDRVDGYQVSFLLKETSDDLVIQARKDGNTFELIPFSRLAKDFPEFLSSDYHHWADLECKVIEFRPLSLPWSSLDSEWLLRYSPIGQTTMKNAENKSLLVDIRSPLFEMLSQQLAPLESARYLHVTLSKQSKNQVQIELPRMKLSFFINEHMQLESHNFCGDIVDSNQSTGTMFGLYNQLVLHSKDPVARSLPRSRSVLVPDGNVQFSGVDHHVSVIIDPGSNRDISFYRYLIDTDLGGLASDTGLTSRLYKIYLHALTSHCLPDTLTGRTGTEEALCGLSEASTFSFAQIDEAQARLLKHIGSLTPDRKYYPAHLKCMQSTNWSALSPLSQHFAFSTVTSSVLERADTLQMFQPLDFNVRALMVSPEAILLQRAARTTSAYYPPGTPSSSMAIFGDINLDDVAHTGRETLDLDWTEEGQIAGWAARLAFRSWGRGVYKPIDLVSLAGSWGSLQRSCDLDLIYSSRWLKLDLSACWITLYNLCRRAAADSNKFRLASCVASAAFSGKLPTDLVPIVVAFATNQKFASLAPPGGGNSHFFLQDGYKPARDRVQDSVASSVRHRGDTPAAHLAQQDSESFFQFEERQHVYYKQHISSYQPQFVQSLLDQWPSLHLQSTSSTYASWFAVNNCVANVQSYFSSCIQNARLCDHLREVERALSSHPTSQGVEFVPVPTPSVEQPIATSAGKVHWNDICLGELMCQKSCPASKRIVSPTTLATSMSTGPPADTNRISELFSEFKKSLRPLNRRYGEDLDKSRKELDNKPSDVWPDELPDPELLNDNRQIYHAMLMSKLHQLQESLAPSTSVEHVVFVSGIWPRITPRALLQQLALKSRLETLASARWRRELVEYTRSFVNYQRSQRLVALAHSKSIEEFWKELELVDTDSGVEENNRDWLLVQIDGNFSPRTVQRQVAKEMMSPSSGSNTILQLNMGEGKSSVIVPLIAASLADTTQLVRVIVLKPLWRQMFRLLVNRLSGLANRRIYYLPFGRHVEVDSAKSQRLRELYAECMREGGILLAQPEHILSFKLMGIEQLISAKPQPSKAAEELRRIQDRLTTHTRDILDESDEILHVRYQLVYTVGEQQPLEGHPDRWTTTQQLLGLLAQHICRLKRTHAESFDYRDKPQGQFPTIRILPDCNSEVEKELIRTLAKDVLAGRLQNLNFTCLPQPVRDRIAQLLSTKDLPYVEYESLKSACDRTMWRGLLLVRGLLVSGILVFALKERHYRVDYGLDLTRSLLAIPFRAKDIPSLRAEFGHPDVAIVLTCLSYYYQGLTDDQLDQCFELLYKMDNPSLEYEQWVARNNQTPKDLRELTGVNLKDREQFRDHIKPTFSQNSAVVDFFLSSVVFPKSAKNFPHKLSTSGWDLAEIKPHVTTGFSGTNDNQYLLPTSITQADPVEQLSTNALVMTYLLQPENNHYLCMRLKGGQTLTTKRFLKMLVRQEPETRVLLDVGAQMLELQNEDLVRCWLELAQNPDVQAAVYFDEDELMILPRTGTPSPFHSSPFAQQLDKCIVYLDDGHTRGTDLKLPQTTRALVTLGPKVTKDRLLQGCMRMRKLGNGQSVIFAAPPEIDPQIRRACPGGLGPNDKVDALDVLRWAMLETCKDLQHHVSHWAQQGLEHACRSEAQEQYSKTQDSLVLKQGWLTPETRKLKKMYGVPSPAALINHQSFTERAFSVPSLRERFDLLGFERLEDPSVDEEQEREVCLEVEREQQIERPPKGKPRTHKVHQAVEHFIQTGQIRENSSGFAPLFHPLGSFGSEMLEGWSTKLFASRDFLRVISGTTTDTLNDYMRPVNWVVQGPNDVRVVLSPYEVNELLPEIRRSRSVKLHIYAPRVTQSMRSFSHLDFYTIPSQSHLPLVSTQSIAQLQLDLFAGQLYLSDYREYTLLGAVLGLYILTSEQTEGDPDIRIKSDGFVKPKYRSQLSRYHSSYAEVDCMFTKSPLPMLKELIGLRRKGMKYSRTHVGRILEARILDQTDF